MSHSPASYYQHADQAARYAQPRAQSAASVSRHLHRTHSDYMLTHAGRQVLEIADRIEVLRLGRRVARFEAKDATIELLVSAMTGGISEEGAA